MSTDLLSSLLERHRQASACKRIAEARTMEAPAGTPARDLWKKEWQEMRILEKRLWAEIVAEREKQ